MFTAKDKEMLGNPYFNIITENPVMYEVQSKNTGHYWVIMPLIDHQFKYLVNDTFVDMELAEIPVAVVFAVFVATIILFIALVMMFFRKSVIEMRGSRLDINTLIMEDHCNDIVWRM